MAALYDRDGNKYETNDQAERVRLLAYGYSEAPPVTEDAEQADYRELQERAKALGIPANQSKVALADAISAADDDEES